MRLPQHLPPPGPAFLAQPHVHRHLSRRQLLQAAAGATATGAVLGAGLFRPRGAVASAPGTANPIPGGSPGIQAFTGHLYHVWAPAAIEPPDAEPATITDFNGVVGLAYISGTVTETNNKTGAKRVLPFVDSDMRFMSGVYRGTDGAVHQGAFGFV